MPSGDLGPAAIEESNHELRLKKSIGVLDSILLAIGFTTTNLQHFITPVAEGGIGISLASEGAIAASLVALGVSTIVIAGVVTRKTKRISRKADSLFCAAYVLAAFDRK